MKWMLSSAGALAIGLLLSRPAQAQQAADEEEAQTSTVSSLVRRVGSVDEIRQLLATPDTGARNQALLVQQGNENQLSVQQYTAQGAALNLVQLQQVGNYNLLDIQQRGAGLEQQITQQGNGNRVTSRMQGTEVESTIRQQGNANSVQQELNVNQRTYLIEQTGNRNELVQRENGPATPTGYQVRMTGNMRVVIEHGP